MEQGRNVRNFLALSPLETWHDILKLLCGLVLLLCYCRPCPLKFKCQGRGAVNSNDFLSISVRTVSHNYLVGDCVKLI